MRPVDQALELFGERFYPLMDFYLQNGYIYSGADAFAMAMPHCKDQLLEGRVNKKLDKCDCWLVQYVSGDIRRLLKMLSDIDYDFEWIVFERDVADIRFSEENRYKAYNLKRLTEKLNGKRKHT
jgi:hypothetical protein